MLNFYTDENSLEGAVRKMADIWRLNVMIFVTWLVLRHIRQSQSSCTSLPTWRRVICNDHDGYLLINRNDRSVLFKLRPFFDSEWRIQKSYTKFVSCMKYQYFIIIQMFICIRMMLYKKNGCGIALYHILIIRKTLSNSGVLILACIDLNVQGQFCSCSDTLHFQLHELLHLLSATMIVNVYLQMCDNAWNCLWILYSQSLVLSEKIWSTLASS